MNFTFKDIHASYEESNGEFNKSLFTDICHEFNMLILDYILDGKERDKDNSDFATFEDAHYIVKLTEGILESNRERKWIKV